MQTTPIAAVQFQHILFYPEPKLELLPALKALDLDVVIWSSLGRIIHLKIKAINEISAKIGAILAFKMGRSD